MPDRQLTVAIIGAGYSGVTCAGHLRRQGLTITLFERQSSAGGVWLFDPRTDREPDYPNEVPPSSAATVSHVSTTYDEISREHAPPGPCYHGLKSNIPISIMRSTLQTWPEGTPDYVSHDVVAKYIQSIHETTALRDHTIFDTKVESVVKQGSRWIVRTQTLSRGDGGGTVTLNNFHLTEKTWEFDAVVVASGHYSVPRIPSIPGLRELRAQFPEKVLHSKSYRSADLFHDKTIFLLGAGVSCLDIARESIGVAKKIYQSTRQGPFDIPFRMMPADVERVGPVDRFVSSNVATTGRTDVVLEDGRVLYDVDTVVLGTGYITSYPFLGHLQDVSLPPSQADQTILITADGYTTHNLHLDAFYIPDPTLAFVGVPYHASSFSLFDFQSEMIARVLAGKAELPSTTTLQQKYRERKAECAAKGQRLHSLSGRDLTYILDNTTWLNAEAERLGHEPMLPVSDDFIKSYNDFLKVVREIGVVRAPEIEADDHLEVVIPTTVGKGQDIPSKIETAEAVA